MYELVGDPERIEMRLERLLRKRPGTRLWIAKRRSSLRGIVRGEKQPRGVGGGRHLGREPLRADDVEG